MFVLLGSGDATFQPPINYPISGWDLVTADFDADGKLDLAVTLPDGVSVLLGNGDGTFQTGVEYPTALDPVSMVAADFNGDGHIDIAVRGEFDWISVLLGLGDGSFSPHVDYKANFGTFGLEAQDLNGDGVLDLAIASYRPTSVITTFLGRGDGTFWRRSDFAAGFFAGGVAIGDFNNDGRNDLVTAYTYSNFLYLLPQVTSVLSKTYIEFGNVKAGNSIGRKVTLSNIGGTAFTINNIALAGRSKTGFRETNNCGSQLDPGESCEVKVVFKPKAAIHYRHASIKIKDSAVNVTQKVYLLGTGTK